MLKWKIVSVSLFNYYFDFALYKYAMYMYAAEPHIVCFFTHPQQKPCNNQQCLPMIPSHTYYFQILQYSLYLGILRCYPHTKWWLLFIQQSFYLFYHEEDNFIVIHSDCTCMDNSMLVIGLTTHYREHTTTTTSKKFMIQCSIGKVAFITVFSMSVLPSRGPITSTFLIIYFRGHITISLRHWLDCCVCFGTIFFSVVFA